MGWWNKKKEQINAAEPRPDPQKTFDGAMLETFTRLKKLREESDSLRQRNGMLLKQMNQMKAAIAAAQEERKMLLDARYDRREADVLLLCTRIAMKVISGGTPTPQEYQDRVMLGQWLKGKE
jgi:hypothetical protein